MRGILIFDHLNDVLFTKCDKEFVKHVHKLSLQQGLVSENKEDNKDDIKLSANIIVQLFSPIVTSQQVMSSQFGNIYTSIKCQKGINMVFDEFMGFTFIYVSKQQIDLMQRTLGVCISIVRRLCGPDVATLKQSKQKTCLVSSLLDAWVHLCEVEQSMLTEAVEQLSVNVDLASATLKVLSDAADKLKSQSELSSVHILVLVEHKFLSLFSTKNAQDLGAADVLFMILLCHVVNGKNNESDDILLFQDDLPREQDGTSSTKLANPTSQDISHLFGDSREASISENLCKLAEDGLYSQLVLLGSDDIFTANAIHISELENGINLLTIVEVTNQSISTGLYNAFHHLNIIIGLQLQRDIDELRTAFDNLEVAIKKIIDGIKKNRSNVSNDVDMSQRRMQARWSFVRKKYNELLKSRDPESILQIESNTSSFVDSMKDLFRLTCFDKQFLKQGTDVVVTSSRLVGQKLIDFSDFLKVKALKNFTLGSRTSLTINKYLEEFPGLVHFIYIDRTTHRLTAPTIDFTNPETLTLTKTKIWNMVEQSRIHLKEGQISVMWKDTTFNYSYFLWFEDNMGTPLKCKTYINHLLKNFPIPGLICGDFYRKLAEACFPKISPNKIRMYELYCIHLGLATSSCVLEHSRRLAATIWEVTGVPNNPVDIL